MPGIGTGTTVSFNGGAIAVIYDVTPPSISRESVNASHMGTTNAHNFYATTLYDGGEVTLELGFDPTWTIPLGGLSGGEIQSCVITFPDGTTWTFDAFITGYEPAVPLEDKMTSSLTFKVDGEITIA